jgi:hypothetical protein
MFQCTMKTVTTLKAFNCKHVRFLNEPGSSSKSKINFRKMKLLFKVGLFIIHATYNF